MERPTRLTASRIIGLDLSKKTLVGCMLTKEDDFQKKRFFSGKMNAAGRSKLASTLGRTDAVFMEGGSSSFTLARFLLNHTESQIFVLNPMQLHLIFESMCKTDRQDAAKIAKYARDAHPENWVLIPIPTEEESAERSIVKLHISYSQLRTKVVNKLHAVFNGQGHPDLKKSDLKDTNFRRDCARTLLTDESSKFCANVLMDQLDCIEDQLACIHTRIQRICMSHPRQARSWLSIPGIGDISAATLIAFIGDGQRFSSANQMRNYIGLTPKKDQSGMVDKQLGIRKHGCMPIRRHIMQGAWGIKKFTRDCSLTRYWKNLESRGKVGQKASVAIANKMISIGFALLKNGELYRMPGDQGYFEQKLRIYKLEALIDDPCTTIDADKSSTIG
jgi:transposase